MRRPAARSWALVAVLAAGGLSGVAFGSAVKRDPIREGLSFSTIIDPTVVPGLDLGIPGTLGGLLTLRVTSHAGYLMASRRREDSRFDWLARQQDVVAMLEGRLFHSAETALGYLAFMSKRPNDAHRVLLRTLQQQSGEWQIYFWIGYLYYKFYGDVEHTVGWWRLAALLPGSPQYLPNLVHLVRLKDAGRLDPLLAQVTEVHLNDPLLREEFALMQSFLRNAEALNRDLRRYARQYGKPATTPQDMLAAGYWSRVPQDPWGGDVRIDVAAHRVRASERAPVFLEPEGEFTVPREIESGAFLRK